MAHLLNRISVLLHGENPSRFDLLLIYLVGIAAGFLILVQNTGGDAALSPLAALVLFVLAVDVSGGVIANVTPSTNRWYHQRPLPVRLAFVAVHFVHPLAAVLVLDPGNWLFLGAVYGYMLLAAVVVLTLPPTTAQRSVALAFYVIGVVGAVYLLTPAPALLWFAPVYFAKLIVCFAVDHYDTRQQATRDGEPAPVGQARHA